MAQPQHDHETGNRLKRRDVVVALTAGLALVAGWLWHDWTRGAVDADALVTGVLFMATVLVGVRCLDLVVDALASQYRLRRRLDRFDRDASDLCRRLEQIEHP